MKVIVTGGAGFIGSNLVDQLVQHGIETHVIDNLSTGKQAYIHPKATFHQVDILDQEKVKVIFDEVHPDAVCHLAAQVDVQQSIESPALDAQTNILGSLNIITLCSLHGSQLIYSSSAAIYGIPLHPNINEQHPISPLSNYGVSKFTPELYIRSYAAIHQLSYTILRYANVYGPRQIVKGEGGVISIFINKMLSNESPIIYGNGLQTRDFIYVSDVVSANLAALRMKINGHYNISTGQHQSINDVLETIKMITGKNIATNYQQERSGDILHSSLDNRLAIKALQWQPKVSLTEGLVKTCAYYQNLDTH